MFCQPVIWDTHLWGIQSLLLRTVPVSYTKWSQDRIQKWSFMWGLQPIFILQAFLIICCFSVVLPRDCPLTHHEEWCHILVSGELQESGIQVHALTCLTGTSTARGEIVCFTVGWLLPGSLAQRQRGRVKCQRKMYTNINFCKSQSCHLTLH